MGELEDLRECRLRGGCDATQETGREPTARLQHVFFQSNRDDLELVPDMRKYEGVMQRGGA